MPQILLKQPGQPVADFAVSGTTVTVAGVTIDCAERQQDTATTVEIRLIEGVAMEGDRGAYLAQIDIPARQYELVEAEDVDGQDGEPAPQTRRPIPLDPNTIVVTLWPIA